MATSVLDKVYVGKSKDEFNIVEVTHSVIGVCGMFGSFIKFVVMIPSTAAESLGNGNTSKRPRARDEDDINTKTLPPYIRNKRNRKDELYNSLIKFCADNELGWVGEPEKFGKQVITDLCNLLWYVTGYFRV